MADMQCGTGLCQQAHLNVRCPVCRSIRGPFLSSKPGAGVWLGLLALVGLNGLGDAIRVLLPGSPLDAAPSLVRIVNFKGEESHNASLQRRPGT